MLNIAMIGCGRAQGGKEGFGIAYAHANAWQALGADVRLFGVDVNPDNLAKFGETYALSKERLFSSTEALYAAVTPDVVNICTWPKLHAPMVIEAATKGVKAIQCEKPMALSMQEIQEMLKVCEEKGVRMALGHQRRFNPYFLAARDLLKSDRLGAPYVLEARVSDGWDIMSWTTHWFDLVNFLFDDTATSVLAGLDYTSERRYGHAVENGSVVFTEYQDKHQAIFITGPDHAYPYPITVRGTKGHLELYEYQPAVLYGDTRQPLTGELADNLYQRGFDDLAKDMHQALEQGTPLRCDAKDTYRATELALAVHESARTLRKVTLPLEAKFTPLEVVARSPKTALHGKRVLLYADEHYGSGGREGIAEALLALTGQAPLVIDAAMVGLEEKDLETIDLLCLYHTQETPLGVTQKTLETWVAAKKPLALLHAALGAYPNWEDYKGWLGRYWKWGSSSHPYEATTLSVSADDPLGLGWREAWLPSDEVYIGLEASSEVIDVLTCTITQGTFPAAWLNAKHSNIACWMPGHRLDAWRVSTLRAGLAALLTRIL